MIHPCGQTIGVHRHDWPFLTLPALGGYTEHYDGGEAHIAGPSGVLHPAGTCHANCIHEQGMETISLEFDADWLRAAGFGGDLGISRTWVGGPVAAASRQLAASWSDASLSERKLAEETGRFLSFALRQSDQAPPAWLNRAKEAAEAPEPPSTERLARELGLHPAWLARAYRSAMGEGLHETARRKRVERAAFLLRTADNSIAEIAAAAGFCDQSHMNRGFKALAGRTPLEVRAERALLAGFQRATA